MSVSIAKKPWVAAKAKEDRFGNPGLLTLEEVAGFLRVSVATVRRWTNAGRLPCYRLGGNGERRFSQEQLQAFLAKHESRGRQA